MENDEIARYLSSLEREDCYRVDAVLKESAHEITQRVFFVGANGAEAGPYVRKLIRRDSGLGAAYERIFESQRNGQRFKHIPTISECYHHGELLVVVMEFVNGETLQDLVYRRDPSLQLAADVFPRLCDAVAELHESFDPPLIHRDLKPSNVMLTEGGLMLIDFGIAREFKDGAEADTTKFGTRAFAPPEQYGFGQTTTRSDIYALGMMLYFCLTEKIPASKVRDAKFQEDDVPPRLRRVLARATDLDPNDRYPSAGELKSAFLEAAAHEAAEQPTEQQKRRQTGRAPVIAACAAIAVVAAICVPFASGAFTQADDQDEATSDSMSQPSENSAESTSDDATQAKAGTDETAKAAEATQAAVLDDMQTNAPQRNGFDPATNLTTTIAGVTFQIPGYFGARTNDVDGRMFYYAETGSSTSMIMASEDSITADEDTVIDAETIEGAKDRVVGGMAQSGSLFAEITSSVDCELAGHPTRIVTFTGSLNDREITTKAILVFNAEIEERTVVVGAIALAQSSNAQFDYSADFAKTVASAVPAS